MKISSNDLVSPIVKIITDHLAEICVQEDRETYRLDISTNGRDLFIEIDGIKYKAALTFTRKGKQDVSNPPHGHDAAKDDGAA